ncbi:MAG: DegV family protein, partial [Candidatus Pacebacteria bacterium]|nr:DegV family protein [Candidatus Paceibacterota bacterium]
LGEKSSKVEVFDSLLVSVPQGILVMKAQEMVRVGRKIQEILASMIQFRKKIKTIAFLEDLSWAVAGGRISGNLARIMTFFQEKGIRVALTIKEGKLTLGGIKVSAKDRIEAIVRELKGKAGKIKVAISHANVPQEAAKLKEELEKIGKEVLYVTEMTLALASHGGPGTLVVSYYEE